MIREGSLLRTAWDAWILILSLATCLIIPSQVAFAHGLTARGSATVYAIDLFFLADILLNFRTSFRREGAEVLDDRQVRRHYLRGLFVVDLLAALPFDALALPARDSLFLGVSVVLWLRMLRTLRIVRLFAILRRWERLNWTNAAALRIFKFLAIVLLLVHAVACAWYLVPYAEGFPEDCWVAREELLESDANTRYVRSLYWAIVTMTTVGYGDITPHRNVEYILTMVVIVTGASMYAFIVGNIASLFSNLDSAKAQFWNRIEVIGQYLRSRQAPPRLNEQVRHYYEYLWERFRGLKENELLSDLPDSARLEILQHLTRDLLEQVPLFRYCTPALRDALLLALRPQIYPPNSWITREGEVGDQIFFITRGEVEIVSDGGRASHGVLTGGDYFGDLSMILRERRSAAARAAGYCDIFVLARRDFERIRSDYAEFKEVLKRVSGEGERTDLMSKLILEGLVL